MANRLEKLKDIKPFSNPLEKVGQAVTPMLANYMQNRLAGLDDPLAGKRYGISEDTWDYVLSKGGKITNVMPFNKRASYEKFIENVNDRKGFEDRLTSTLYMASLTRGDPLQVWDIDSQLSRYIFNKKQLSPSQIMSAAVKNEKIIDSYYKSWNRALAELDEMPSWFEDVIVNQLAGAIASTKSFYPQMRADLLSGGEELTPEQLARGMHNPYFGKPNEAMQKMLRDRQIDYQKIARLYWEVSKDPQIALKRDDIISELFAIGMQTGPYITGTTVGTLVVGPMGGFAVGSSLMANTAYQKAKDENAPETQARAIAAGVGLFSGIVEATGGVVADKYVGIITQKLTDKYLAKGAEFALSSAVEGIEEGLQEIADYSGEGFYRDINVKEGAKRVLVASAGGVAVGGAYGMGRRTIQSVFGTNISAEQRRKDRLAAAGEKFTAETVAELEKNIDKSLKAQEEAKKAAEAAEKAPAPPVEAEGAAEGEETLLERQERLKREKEEGKLSDFDIVNIQSRLKQLRDASERITQQIRYQEKFEGDTGIPEVDAKDAENLRKNKELLQQIEDEMDQLQQALDTGIKSREAPAPRKEAEAAAEGEVIESQIQQTVYHGTDKAFESFSEKELLGLGFHFGTEQQAKQRAGKFGGQRLIPARIILRNPLRVVDKGLGDAWTFVKEYSPHHSKEIKTGQPTDVFSDAEVREFAKTFGISAFENAGRPSQYKSGDKQAMRWVVQRLKEKGYDGLVYANEYEGPGDSYVVFSEDQIISRPAPAEAAPVPKAQEAKDERIPKEVFPEIKGEGETKTRGLAKNIANELQAATGTEEEGLPTYQVASQKERLKKLADFVVNEPDRAMRVAMGEEESPQGFFPEDVLTAVRIRAREQGDYNTLRDLETLSPIVTGATELGRRIQALASEATPEDPSNAMKDLIKSREVSYGEKKGIQRKEAAKAVKKAKKEISKSIKKEIKTASTVLSDWTAFVQSLQC